MRSVPGRRPSQVDPGAPVEENIELSTRPFPERWTIERQV
jgi:hypothetical protein